MVEELKKEGYTLNRGKGIKTKRCMALNEEVSTGSIKGMERDETRKANIFLLHCRATHRNPRYVRGNGEKRKGTRRG